MSSKLTRVSIEANLPRKDNTVKMSDSGLPLFDLTIGVHGMYSNMESIAKLRV